MKSIENWSYIKDRPKNIFRKLENNPRDVT